MKLKMLKPLDIASTLFGTCHRKTLTLFQKQISLRMFKVSMFVTSTNRNKVNIYQKNNTNKLWYS